jgi:hypothetical protein
VNITEKVRSYIVRATIGFAVAVSSFYVILVLKRLIPPPWIQLIGTLILGAGLIFFLYGVGFLFAATLDYSALISIRRYCRRNSLKLLSTEITSKKYKADYLDASGQCYSAEWISFKDGFKNSTPRKK